MGSIVTSRCIGWCKNTLVEKNIKIRTQKYFFQNVFLKFCITQYKKYICKKKMLQKKKKIFFQNFWSKKWLNSAVKNPRQLTKFFYYWIQSLFWPKILEKIFFFVSFFFFLLKDLVTFWTQNVAKKIKKIVIKKWLNPSVKKKKKNFLSDPKTVFFENFFGGGAKKNSLYEII